MCLGIILKASNNKYNLWARLFYKFTGAGNLFIIKKKKGGGVLFVVLTPGQSCPRAGRHCPQLAAELVLLRPLGMHGARRK